MTKNDEARKHGISKAMRQYNVRYGRGGIAALVQCHAQNPAHMLDHWMDKAVAMGGSRWMPYGSILRRGPI